MWYLDESKHVGHMDTTNSIGKVTTDPKRCAEIIMDTNDGSEGTFVRHTDKELDQYISWNQNDNFHTFPFDGSTSPWPPWETSPPYRAMPPIEKIGWQCPKCKTVYAPHMDSCTCQVPKAGDQLDLFDHSDMD